MKLHLLPLFFSLSAVSLCGMKKAEQPALTAREQNIAAARIATKKLYKEFTYQFASYYKSDLPAFLLSPQEKKEIAKKELKNPENPLLSIKNNFEKIIKEDTEKTEKKAYLNTLSQMILTFISKLHVNLIGTRNIVTTSLYNHMFSEILTPYAVLYKVVTEDNKDSDFPQSTLSHPQYLFLEILFSSTEDDQRNEFRWNNLSEKDSGAKWYLLFPKLKTNTNFQKLIIKPIQEQVDKFGSFTDLAKYEKQIRGK